MTTSDKPDNASETPAEPTVEHTGVAAQDWTKAAADPQYRAAVVDLLGALAYGELAAFERLAEDAKLAPTLADKAELAKMASAEFHHYEKLRDRLTEIGEEPTLAMEPFVAALDGFHRQTAPSDWLEGSSRRTSATRSPVTSTGRSRRGSTRTRASSSWPSSTTPDTPGSPSRRCGRRSTRTRGWAADWPCGRGG